MFITGFHIYQVTNTEVGCYKQVNYYLFTTTVDELLGLLGPGEELDLTPPGRAGGCWGSGSSDGNSKHYLAGSLPLE